MSTPHEDLQAILRQVQAPLDYAMYQFLGELGALVARLEDENRDDDLRETNALGIYNEVYDLQLQVKQLFETWLKKWNPRQPNAA